VIVTLASDGVRLAASILDHYGSLSPPMLLERVGQDLRKPFRDVKQDSGGAGLGLAFVFDALTDLVINLQPSKRTEMIGILPCAGNFRDFASRSKSFNLFVDDR
jgi:hypothetical protein